MSDDSAGEALSVVPIGLSKQPLFMHTFSCVSIESAKKAKKAEKKAPGAAKRPGRMEMVEELMQQPVKLCNKG